MQVLCNPSNFHIEPAIDLAKRKVNIFMEKPLSITMDKIDTLNQILRMANIIFMIL